MDRIRLKDITLFTRLGVTSWEKRGVQKVRCDVDLSLDLTAAAKADRIQAAVDYEEVYGLVEEVAKARKYHLIESLAQGVVAAVLERFPAVQTVTVRLRKTSLPFDAHLDCVEVELERSR